MSIRLQSCCTTKEKCAQSLLVHLRPKSHRGLIHFLNGSPTTRASIVALRFSSSSSKRWQTRQGKDKFATTAKVQGLKSRAAFKLLEIDQKHKIFRKGQTIVDLVCQVTHLARGHRTSPGGRVLGIDVIPAQPPRGVSTIQGNFLSPSVQEEVKRYLQQSNQIASGTLESVPEAENNGSMIEDGVAETTTIDYLDLEKKSAVFTPYDTDDDSAAVNDGEKEGTRSRLSVADVVLSDMSAPWDQTEGFWKRSLSNPYSRMMNTSGINFRDHAGSMDLCDAALRFAFDVLRTGGHFVCKFYQGSEDSVLESRLKKLFAKVHREKPESSRSVESS
ncbi:MAG: hypothetical protein Q9190_006389 [Brigantiaea leucoxantha]